jgi:hypothetical protein
MIKRAKNKITAVGGIAGGFLGGSISHCSSLGNVSGIYSVGGVAGFFENCDIQSCSFYGNVSGNKNVGGVVGDIFDSNMRGCFSKRHVSGNSSVGGVAGYVEGCEIFGCDSFCDVSGERLVGGIAGDVFDSNICACFLKGNVHGTDFVGGIAGSFVTSKLDNDINKTMTDCSDMTDFNKPASNTDSFFTPDTVVYTTQDGTSSNPYIITTAEQLAQLATDVNAGKAGYSAAHYKLGNDIDLSEYGETWNNGKGWIPIGTKNMPFKGFFDGNKKKITGLYIKDYTLVFAGLFGFIFEGTVKNLGVLNVNIKVNVIDLDDDVEEEPLDESFKSYEVSVSREDNLDDMIALCMNKLMYCYSTGNVIGKDHVGGIVGFVLNLFVMTDCYSTGAVIGNEFVGGLAGFVVNSGVLSCAALNPIVEGLSDVGRVVGCNIEAFLSDNIAFDGIISNAGNTTWSNIGADDLDGEDISKEEINADGTLGGRFTNEDWIVENGKLPIFAKYNVFDMPEHLCTHPQLSVEIYPYPTGGEIQVLGLEFDEEGYDITQFDDEEYTIYSITGQIVLQGNLQGNLIDVALLESGIYCLEIVGQTAKFFKQ